MRTGLLLIGIWVGVLGYAILYNGLTGLNPELSPTGAQVGFVDGLVPGRVKGTAKSTGATRAVVPPKSGLTPTKGPR